MSPCPGRVAHAHRQPASAHRQLTDACAGDFHSACARRNCHSIAGAYAYRAASHSIASGYRYRGTGLTDARTTTDTHGCASNECAPNSSGAHECANPGPDAHTLHVHLVCVESSQGVPRAGANLLSDSGRAL